MKTKIRAGIVLGTFLFLLPGCAQIPDLTQEQSRLVAEYAAGMLMKYDKNSDSRLMTDEEMAAYEVKQAEKAKKQEEALAAEQARLAAKEGKKNQSKNEEQTEQSDSGQQEAGFASIAEFLQIEGLDVQYDGYEVTDTYPKDDLSLSVTATQGKSLVILRFRVTNTAQQDISADIMSKGLRCSVQVNGDQTFRALTTMLVNDFSTYSDTIPQGETVDTVMVLQLPSEQCESINEMVMTIKSADGSMTLGL